MLLSLKTEGCISYDCSEDEFISNLALDIDEDEDNVSVAVAFLMKNKLLQRTDKESERVLPQAVKAIGSETASTIRSRECRARKKVLQCNANATEAQQLGSVEKERELDIELDIEIDKQQQPPIVPQAKSKVVVVDDPYSFWGKNMGCMTEYAATVIQDMVANYGEVTTLEGMRAALMQGKRTLAYVEGCCKNIHAGNTKPEKEKLLF